MGSLGNDGGETKPTKKNAKLDIADTQVLDSQFSSPPSSPGETGRDADDLCYFEDTVPFDDTVPLEYAFETQVMNLGGETQVVNLDGETQLLDDPDWIENAETQLLDVFDGDIAPDSEGEGTNKTEVLDDSNELSDDDSVTRNDGQLDNRDKMQCTDPHKYGEEGVKERADVLIDEQCNTGSLRRDFTSVRAASLRASGLAARNMALKHTSNDWHSEELVLKNNGLSSLRDSPEVGKEVIQEHDRGNYNENVAGFGSENKSGAGRSAVRKLFIDEDDKEFPFDSNNAGKGEELIQFPVCDGDVAGLSYADSQEPGDLTQTNALDFVDKFLRNNIMGFDLDIDHGNSTGGKSKSLSSAKGPHCLAKRANAKFIVREAGVFDWDDSREDEGGGDIFCRKKEEFFDSRGHGSFPRSKKPKGCRVNKQRDKESNRSKLTGLVYSDSRLMYHNGNVIKKGAQIAEMNFKRNLVNEFDEQLNVNCLKGQLESIVTNSNVPEIQDIGHDTQLAAEAMEALCQGKDLANHDANGACQGIQNNYKVSPDGDCRENIENSVCSQQPCSRNEKHPSNIGVTRQSENTQRIGTELSEETLISMEKRSKNVGKWFDTVSVITRSKRSQSNRNLDLEKLPSKISEQRYAGALERSHTSHDGTDVNRVQSGGGLIKKRHLQGEGVTTPIAKRTRQSLVASQSRRAQSVSSDCREDQDMSKIEAYKVRRRNSRATRASSLLKAKQKYSKTGSSQSGEVENAKPSQYEQSDPKFSAVENGVNMDTLTYPKRRRSLRKLPGQVKRSNNLDGPSKPSARLEDTGRSINRQERSHCNRTSIDFGTRWKTQSSSFACPDLSSVDKNLDGRLSEQSLDKGDVLEADRNCTSAYTSVEMKSKDAIGTEAVKLSDRNADSLLPKENAEASARSHESPREKSTPPGSASATPDYCKTPVHDASPICMGSEYFKLSCRRNLSRSCLTREISSLSSTGSERTPVLKDLRKRRDMANVRVLYSHHLDEDIVKQQKKILARLGVSIASSVSDATHFITGKFVRTRNMLEAIASGKPVVTHLWLESCGQANCFIDEKNYILRDTKKEREFGFSMPVSLARAIQCPLLQGRRVLITPNTKPGKEIISSLVKAVKGQAVERIGRSSLKDDRVPDDLLVLSCEEDHALCVPFLEKGAAVYSSELLLNGIVTQKLDYERHRLFADDVKKTRSTIWMRKDGNEFLPVAKRKRK